MGSRCYMSKIIYIKLVFRSPKRAVWTALAKCAIQYSASNVVLYLANSARPRHARSAVPGPGRSAPLCHANSASRFQARSATQCHSRSASKKNKKNYMKIWLMVCLSNVNLSIEIKVSQLSRCLHILYFLPLCSLRMLLGKGTPCGRLQPNQIFLHFFQLRASGGVQPGSPGELPTGAKRTVFQCSQTAVQARGTPGFQTGVLICSQGTVQVPCEYYLNSVKSTLFLKLS